MAQSRRFRFSVRSFHASTVLRDHCGGIGWSGVAGVPGGDGEAVDVGVTVGDAPSLPRGGAPFPSADSGNGEPGNVGNPLLPVPGKPGID